MTILTNFYKKFFPENKIQKMFNDFKENAVYADEVYKNKKLIIKGYISSIEKNFINGNPTVFVDLNKSNFFISKSFCCIFKKEETKNLLKLKKKQKICIEAEYSYFSSTIIFKNCKLKQKKHETN